jgi:hypothetical protein
MPGKNGAETRRSSRVTLRVPLKIYEPETNKRFFVEEAYAVKVSLWGGLIALRAAVNRNQHLWRSTRLPEKPRTPGLSIWGPCYRAEAW